MDEMSNKLLHAACDAVNAAYTADEFERYEELIAHYAQMLGVSCNWLEDEATTVRYRGWDYD